MRICHMFHGKDEIRFGIYACSPEDSAFKACFTNMELTEPNSPILVENVHFSDSLLALSYFVSERMDENAAKPAQE